MKSACVGILSIIELKNARWNIEIHPVVFTTSEMRATYRQTQHLMLQNNVLHSSEPSSGTFITKVKKVPIFAKVLKFFGAWGSVVAKVLRYWSDGPGIDSRWCH